MELKDTVELMLSEDHDDRLKAEYYQAVIRSRRLKNILDDYHSNKLKFELKCSIDILESQYVSMTVYIGDLVERARIEGVELKEVKYNE